MQEYFTDHRKVPIKLLLVTFFLKLPPRKHETNKKDEIYISTKRACISTKQLR